MNMIYKVHASRGGIAFVRPQCLSHLDRKEVHYS